MANEILKHDSNRTKVIGGVTDDASLEIAQIRVDPITKRLLIDNDALPGNTDGTYIGDIKFGESLPAGTNYLGQVGIDADITVGDIGILSGSSRLGNIQVQRDGGGYINKITIVQGGTTRELNIVRDVNNLIASITENV